MQLSLKIRPRRRRRLYADLKLLLLGAHAVQAAFGAFEADARHLQLGLGAGVGVRDHGLGLGIWGPVLKIGVYRLGLGAFEADACPLQLALV